MQVIAKAVNLPGSAQGASSTAEFYHDDSKGVDAIVSIPINAVLTAVTGAAGVAGSASASLKTGKPFVVRAGGYINAQAGTTPDFNFKIDAGDSTTIASNTTIADTGSIVLDNDTTIQTFHLEARCLLGHTDSKLQGEFQGWVNNTVIARTVLTESVEDLVATKILSFKATGTFSESIASQTAVLTYLEVLA